MQVTSPAGFWKRLAANVLDSLVVGVPIGVIGVLLTDAGDIDWFSSLANLVYAVIVPAVWHGYTVGKRIMGIRIVKVNGDPVGIGTMLLRSVVGGLVYVITLGIGVIVSVILVAVREDKRSMSLLHRP